jgi:exoribonuclease R
MLEQIKGTGKPSSTMLRSMKQAKYDAEHRHFGLAAEFYSTSLLRFAVIRI